MTRIVPLLLAFLVAGGGPPAADGGRFTVFAAGTEAGFEEFSLSLRNGRLVLESRAVLRRADREQELELEVALDPASGEVLSLSTRGRAGERVRAAIYSREGGRLVGEVREGETARTVALDLPPGALPVLDPFTAPYLLLAYRYDRQRGTPATFPIFHPVEGVAGEATIVHRGEEAITLDDRAEVVTRLVVRPDRGEPANLWLDDAGRLLVCARSVAGLSAVRGGQVRLGQKPGEDPPAPPGTEAFRLRFAGPAGVMAGTLWRPEGPPGPVPAALILSGSGPQDRNGNAPGGELQWNHLASFAAALAGQGIATFRYDERGTGASAGTFGDAGLGDLLADARTALAYLASRDDVDPARIALVGHSEGALLAAWLGGEGAVPVRALATVGAPAEPLDRILLGQVRRRLAARGIAHGDAERIVGELRAYFEHVRLSEDDVLEWEGREREVRWLRDHLSVDPLAVYARVRAPALVLHGGRDTQVPVDQASRVAAAFGRAVSARLVVLDGLDHFLMVGTEGTGDYVETSRRVAPAALDALAEGLSALLDRGD